MNNCFTFTYERLKLNGIKLPIEWNEYKYNKQYFIDNQKELIENKVHIRFFEEFFDYVKTPRYGDIVINKSGVGFVVNQFTYQTVLEKNSNVILKTIRKRDKIMRAR